MHTYVGITYQIERCVDEHLTLQFITREAIFILVAIAQAQRGVAQDTQLPNHAFTLAFATHEPRASQPSRLVSRAFIHRITNLTFEITSPLLIQA